MASLGAPDLRLVILVHPIGHLGQEDVLARANAAADALAALLERPAP
jgi:hypothetical protein